MGIWCAKRSRYVVVHIHVFSCKHLTTEKCQISNAVSILRSRWHYVEERRRPGVIGRRSEFLYPTRLAMTFFQVPNA